MLITGLSRNPSAVSIGHTTWRARLVIILQVETNGSDYHPLCDFLVVPLTYIPPYQRHPEIRPVSRFSFPVRDRENRRSDLAATMKKSQNVELTPSAQPPATAGQARPPPPALQNASNKIQLWVKGNYDTAMKFVAYAELAILGRVVFGAVT